MKICEETEKDQGRYIITGRKISEITEIIRKTKKREKEEGRISKKTHEKRICDK
jgi:hypothetical protein